MDPSKRARLLELLKSRSFQEREVILSSGLKSNFYIDCKQATLDAFGHVWVGRLLFDQIVRFEGRSGKKVAGVGGLTLGADPIASAVSLTSALMGHPIPAMIVRKEPKGHGTGAYLEGAKNILAGGEVAIVEDVVTTGGSAIHAIERVREEGFEVVGVVTILDRLSGGAEAIRAAANGAPYTPLTTIDDVYPDRPDRA